MSVVLKATGFTAADFDRLGRTASEPDAISSQSQKIDALIHGLNQTTFASRFMAARTSMGLNAEGLYSAKGEYVHGGDNGHWYIFHRGGRWEPEFNIGMYGTRPGRERYLRIGLGFNLTLASKDPNRQHGQQRVKELFRNLQWASRSSSKAAVVSAVTIGRAKAEHVGEPTNTPPQSPDAIADWVARHVDPDATRWLFIGRALSPDDPGEAAILADMRTLVSEASKTFTGWLPVWETALRGIE